MKEIDVDKWARAASADGALRRWLEDMRLDLCARIDAEAQTCASISLSADERAHACGRLDALYEVREVIETILRVAERLKGGVGEG